MFYNVFFCINCKQIKFFRKIFRPSRALPPSIFIFENSLRARIKNQSFLIQNQSTSSWSVRNGGRTPKRLERNDKKAQSLILFQRIQKNVAQLCFLLFFLRHKERACQACLVCERLLAAQQSRLAD